MARKVKAVPVKPLVGHNGKAVPMREGSCLWCGQWVTSQRDEAGTQDPYDPCWASEFPEAAEGVINGGDFRCDMSPETGDDGCGGHARPYDLARHLLRNNRAMPGCGP